MLSYLTSFLSFSTVSWKYIPVFTLCVKLCHPAMFCLIFLPVFISVCQTLSSCHVLVGLSLCLHSCVSNSVLPAMFLVGLSSCLHSFLPVFIPLCQTLCFLSCFGWSVFFLSSCNMFLSSLLCVKLCFLPYIHWSVFSCTV